MLDTVSTQERLYWFNINLCEVSLESGHGQGNFSLGSTKQEKTMNLITFKICLFTAP